MSDAALSRSEAERVQAAIQEIADITSRQTDRVFAVLLLVQWAAMVALAYWVTPRTWIGPQSALDPFLLLAVFLGGALSLGPILLVRLYPGRAATRHAIAVGQMLSSSLLIHLTGGRIETHFHIFGSLALLAFYLDWTVLLTASLVVVADHILRGIYLPAYIFGIGNLQPWRWLEHAGWVVFCDIFLIASCLHRLGKVRLIAQQQVRQEDLLQKAYTDTLTGLPNRLALQAELERLLEQVQARGTRFHLFYIDLDNFKAINDDLGHAVGDLVLRETARRLTSCMPPGGMAARIGGDEFIAVLPDNLEPEQTTDLADKLLTSFQPPVSLGGQSLQLSASIGACLCPDHGRSVEELLEKADSAMYTVKTQGRRGFAFYKEATGGQAKSSELAAAMEQDDFAVVYQPLVTSEGRLQALEALLRWRSPTRGMVLPGGFLPLAERAGLLPQIGAATIEKVCRQIEDWSAAGLPFGRIAVNLSLQELESPLFLATLDAVLGRYPSAASRLSFEIAETACEKSALLAECAAALHARGIGVCLDNFGMGCPSLDRLHELRLDTLKIDRAFVSRLGSSPAAAKVVEAAVHIAHLLGINVAAGGVETKAQLEMLRAFNCDLFQGFFFAKPLTPEHARQFLLERVRENAADLGMILQPNPPVPPALLQISAKPSPGTLAARE